MMKHLLFLLSICLLTSCYTKEEPSTIDPKPVDFEGNMNKTIKPGDDFFMYCNGAWYDRTDLGINNHVGFIPGAIAQAEERFKNLNNTAISNFYHSVANIDKTIDAAVALLKKDLKLVENITTKEEAAEAVVQIMLAGYDYMQIPEIIYKEGRARVLFSFPWSFMLDFKMVEYCMTELGMTDIQERLARAQRLYNHLSEGQSALDMSTQNQLAHPEMYDRFVPLCKTRANTNGILDKMLKVLNADYQDAMIDESAYAFFSKLDEADPKDLQCLLQAQIANEYTYSSTIAYEKCAELDPYAPSFDGLIEQYASFRMSYLYSYAFAKQYVSEDRKAKMQLHCEELRSAFRQRLDQLTWMSSTTKQKAHKKLNAMVFNVGCPDQWVESALPDLNGASLLENMHMLAHAHDNYIKETIGKTRQESSFGSSIIGGMMLHIVNAFYDWSSNSMNILPAFLLEPFYDEGMSDAYNYAIFSVIGHEITHGFGTIGGRYNDVGDFENWWTVADQMEYIARQQQLIDCYNLLEIMPTELPGVYANGALTLDENIADLGGVQVAYQAYMAKLLREGYKDEELHKQQQKFFQSYANFWRSKYSVPFALNNREKDEHSLFRERVNGAMMNMDQWYSLYNVKWGDNLYLKPEKRTNIW